MARLLAPRPPGMSDVSIAMPGGVTLGHCLPGASSWNTYQTPVRPEPSQIRPLPSSRSSISAPHSRGSAPLAPPSLEKPPAPSPAASEPRAAAPELLTVVSNPPAPAFEPMPVAREPSLQRPQLELRLTQRTSSAFRTARRQRRRKTAAAIAYPNSWRPMPWFTVPPDFCVRPATHDASDNYQGCARDAPLEFESADHAEVRGAARRLTSMQKIGLRRGARPSFRVHSGDVER